MLVVKSPLANAGDLRGAGLIPGLERSPGGRNGNPVQYSCLENSMDRGAWRDTVHGVAKSRTWLSMSTKKSSWQQTQVFWRLDLLTATWYSRLPPATCVGRRQGLASDFVLSRQKLAATQLHNRANLLPAPQKLLSSESSPDCHGPSSLSLPPMLFLRLRKRWAVSAGGSILGCAEHQVR